MEQEMLERLSNIREKSPALLVDRAAVLFKENYSGEIYSVETQEELKNFVETFSNMEYSGILVVEDISKVYDLSTLLKFLEEIKTPIILLAYKDSANINSVILSRVKTLIKFPYDMSKSKSIPAKDAISLWNQDLDQDKFYADESPELYYLKAKSSKYVCNTKIVDLLSKGGTI